MNRKIVIIGGGISGLALGYYLTKYNYQPIIMEKEAFLGGTGATFSAAGRFYEKHYHYFLAKDSGIIKFLHELGLAEKIIWQKAKIGLFAFTGIKFLGYLSQTGINTLATGFDFICYPGLSVKERFLLLSLYIKLHTIKDCLELENISAKEWIIGQSSRKIYEHIFRPIICAKWGSPEDRISASWLIARMGARMDFEKMIEGGGIVGYLEGSFQDIYDNLEKKIIAAGGRIEKRAEVLEIRHQRGQVSEIVYRQEREKKIIPVECVVVTSPLPEFAKIVFLPEELEQECAKIEYQRVISACLNLKRPLTKVLNLVCIPGLCSVNGLVELTAIIPESYYQNQSILYLFKYINDDDPQWGYSDTEIENKWRKELGILFPSFSQDDVNWFRLSKNLYNEPISILGATREINQFVDRCQRTIKGLFIAGVIRVPFVQDFSNLIKSAWEVYEEMDTYLKTKED